MKKDHKMKLTGALKKFWEDYGRKSRPIKGAHTEVIIEPSFFCGDKLNPEVAELMLTVYLSTCTAEDLKNGKISIQNGLMEIKDKFGKPVANIRKQRIIREFIQRTEPEKAV